jgi:hypothetical protein
VVIQVFVDFNIFLTKEAVYLTEKTIEVCLVCDVEEHFVPTPVPGL